MHIVSLKLILGRVIPFCEKYPELGHMNGHLCFLILFAGVDNKTDARVFRFSKQKYFEKF